MSRHKQADVGAVPGPDGHDAAMMRTRARLALGGRAAVRGQSDSSNLHVLGSAGAAWSFR